MKSMRRRFIRLGPEGYTDYPTLNKAGVAYEYAVGSPEATN